MNAEIIITSQLNRELLGDHEAWLVIGPYCWGRSRSLPEALEIAAAELSYGGGSFSACVIPNGELTINDDGSYYRVADWTEEQRKRAADTGRVVAITRSAAKRWREEANTVLKLHRKALKQ